jgi:hypothetical protein
MPYIGATPTSIPLTATDIPDLPATKITSGTFPALNGSNLTNIDAGKVLQVVQASSDSVISQTGNGGTRYDVTGLSASITPSATSSKVLVTAQVHFNNASSEQWKGYIVRGSTDIGVSTASSSSTATFPLGSMANTNNYWLSTTSATILDSPNTTSSTTYKVGYEVLSGSTFTLFINKPSRNTSTDVAVTSFLTLMEIGA